MLVVGALLVATMLPMELLARNYMTVHLNGAPKNWEVGPQVSITFPAEGASHLMKVTGNVTGDRSSQSIPVGDIRGVTFRSDGQGVESETHRALPQGFGIIGNYPNPFNGGTTIRYQLERAGLVSVRVCDLSGKVVSTLVETLQPAGSYAVRWEGTGAPAGIYFCKLGFEDRVEARRMVLLK